MIVLRDLCKVYHGGLGADTVALDGISLEIEDGEFVAIMGPSGSGKSTLLNLIGGLDRPTSGRITIAGHDLSALGDDDLTRLRRDNVGFIFQFFNLLPSLTCFENVALPLHLRGWKRRAIDARTRELLGMVALTSRADHLPDELSGGERQRVAIARALAVFPPILPDLLGHPWAPVAVVADKAYDSRAIRQAIRDDGAIPVIPPRRTANNPAPYDERLYRLRNIVERFFCRCKDMRRIATRFDKLARKSALITTTNLQGCQFPALGAQVAA